VKILVTGATGFVGGHFVKRLIQENHEVHVLIRPTSNLSAFEDNADPVKVHRFNGSTDGMIDLVREANPDVVAHLAALYIGEHQSDDVENLVNSNLLFPVQLAEAMSVNKVQKMINVGTSWQHFDDAEFNPVNLYAATKQAYRALLRYYVETSETRIIHLELFDTYGPDDHRGKLFSLLDGIRKSGDKIAMSPGEQRLDPVYIDDVIDAFMIALEQLNIESFDTTHGQETYSVCTGAPVSLRELVKVYEDVIGQSLDIEWGGREYRAREVMLPWSLGGTLPGWAPRISLVNGIRRTLQDDV
jgi:nucleoside-diphosphate-sugar epimerase